MPTSVADGVLGLEAKHVIGPITLNDLTVMPRYKLDRIGNLHGLPEAEDNRKPRSTQMGEYPLPGYPRGKTVTYEGRVQAYDLQTMRYLGNQLRAALGERYREVGVSVVPHAGWGSTVFTWAGRVLQFDMDDEQTTGPRHVRPWQRNFSFGLRMSDARFYSGRFDSPSGLGGGTTDFHNDGTAPADPAFEIFAGAGSVVTITDLDVVTSNGTARLRFNLPASWGSGKLRVFFSDRSAWFDKDSGGTMDALGRWDHAYSQWWDEVIPGLAPGVNRVGVSGHDGRGWSGWFNHASW